MVSDKEWYTYEEIATMLGVALSRVQKFASVLASTGAIKTRRNPQNMRMKEVHKDSIPVLRDAILAEQ